MPDFKQLAEGEKPTDLERFILIEVIHEPAIGKQWFCGFRENSGVTKTFQTTNGRPISAYRR